MGYRDTTPLMYAAAFGTVEAMSVLIDAGANVNAKNAFDATALMWGAADPAKVRLLLDKGSDVNAKSKQGRTPFIIAASSNGAKPILQLLIANGADAKTTDASKNTALIAAAQANDAESVDLLIDKGVDVNARNVERRDCVDVRRRKRQCCGRKASSKGGRRRKRYIRRRRR